MVLVPASFSEAVLAIHLIGVVVAFGVTFSYPVFALFGSRDRRSMPTLHRAQAAISRMVITPGLLVILIAGIVLASDEHQWKAFFVQWGIGAVIVLMGAEHALILPRERKLAELAERDVQAAGGGEVRWSAEYDAVFRQTGIIGAVLDLIVIVTIFLMAFHA